MLQLIQYYKDCKTGAKEVTLENFWSQNIPNVQLNLEPIFVKVTNLETCKTLMEITLQILAENLPINSINIDKDMPQYKILFSQLINVLEYYNVDLKLIVLNFFNKLIENYDQIGLNRFCHLFPDVFKELLSCIGGMMASMSIFYEKGEVDHIYMKDFNKIVINLLNIRNQNCLDEFHRICSVILYTKDNTIFNKDLKLLCLSLSKELDMPEDLLALKNLNSIEIDAVKDRFSEKILIHIENQGSTDLKENWYYKEILEVIKLLKTCEDQNLESFLISHHLKRCLSAVDILVNVQINNKLRQDTKLLNSDTVFCVWRSLMKLIQYHKQVLLQEVNLLKLVLNITLDTTVLCNNLSKEDSDMVLQIVCLQTMTQFSEQHLNYSDAVKAEMALYVLLIKTVLKSKLGDSWIRIILGLVSSPIRNKSLDNFVHVSFFSLS